MEYAPLPVWPNPSTISHCRFGPLTLALMSLGWRPLPHPETSSLHAVSMPVAVPVRSDRIASNAVPVHVFALTSVCPGQLANAYATSGWCELASQPATERSDLPVVVPVTVPLAAGSTMPSRPPRL